MPFQPEVGDVLEVDGKAYKIAEHPNASGMPYGQEGRQAIVYQLSAGGRRLALKVSKPRFRLPSLVPLGDLLGEFAVLPGLQVCRRTVLGPERYADLVSQHPDLAYAVVMPWIDGPTWMESLFSGQRLTPEQSLDLAHGLLSVLVRMEQRGLAHCDLSGPNVLLPALAGEARVEGQAGIELVDIEQIYAPSVGHPELLPSGSQGYAHRSAMEGVWSPEADRFAGAVLLAEMLGWCDERVRTAAWGESYFDPKEMQQDRERYTVLAGVLRERWGRDVAELFERAWRSATLSECVTFGEWLVSMPRQAASPVAPPRGSKAAEPALRAERDDGETIRALLDLARDLEAQGNAAGAFEAYSQAYKHAAPDSTVRALLGRLLAERAGQRSSLPVAGASPPWSRSGGESRSGGGRLADRLASEVSTYALIALVFAIAGLGGALLVLAGWAPVAAAASGALGPGDTALGGAAYAVCAALVGLVEAWLLRARISGPRQVTLIAVTALAGCFGGLDAAIFVASGLPLGLAAAVGGAIAGGLAGFGQTLLLRSSQFDLRWVFWNVLTWAAAWGIASLASLFAPAGALAGAGSTAMVLLATGASLALFLYWSPDVEL